MGLNDLVDFLDVAGELRCQVRLSNEVLEHCFDVAAVQFTVNIDSDPRNLLADLLHETHFLLSERVVGIM